MMICKYILVLYVCFGFFVQTSLAEELKNTSLLKKVISHSKSQPIKILCLGDSVTGIYYHTGSRRAYSNLIQAGLQQMDLGVKIEVINAGISGNTSGAGLLRLRKLLERHKPQILTIMFGLNDAAVHCPTDEYKQNLARMVDMAKKYGTESVICTPNSVIETKRRPRNIVAQYAVAAREIANEKKTPLADIYSEFERVRKTDVRDWMMLFSDGEIHPNILGHKIITQEIIIALTGLKPPRGTFDVAVSAMPHTIKKLKEGQSVKILAAEPYGQIFKEAIMQICPDARVEIEFWKTGDKSVRQSVDDLKKRRGKKFWSSSIGADMLIIVIPQSGFTREWNDNLKNISELLCNALVFDPSKNVQTWDVICVSGSLLKGKANALLDENQLLFETLLRSRDIVPIKRFVDDGRDVTKIIHDWVLTQYTSTP